MIFGTLLRLVGLLNLILVYYGQSVFNPLLGAIWPIVYFLQGRLGIAAIFMRAYWFVWPAIVANIPGMNSRYKKSN